MPTEDLPAGRTLAGTVGDIHAASDDASLRAGLDRAREAVAAELGGYTPAAVLAAGWSDVLRHSVASAVRLVEPTDEWTWFVSGSVARGEAAPGSDVETMVVLDDGVADERKRVLLDRAADVHALLDRSGVTGDANGVLASRPRFCRRLRSWSDGLDAWTAEPRRDRGVVMTGLLADASGIGATAMPEELRVLTAGAVAASYPARAAVCFFFGLFVLTKV